MEYFLDWSPWVGQEWLNVEAMEGSGCLTGIAIGICGSAVAEVGGGGRARESGSMPGINSVKTFVSPACPGRALICEGKLGGGGSACSGGRDQPFPFWSLSAPTSRTEPPSGSTGTQWEHRYPVGCHS